MTNSEIVERARHCGFRAIRGYDEVGGVLIWLDNRPVGRLEVEDECDIPFECMDYFKYGVIAFGIDA